MAKNRARTVRRLLTCCLLSVVVGLGASACTGGDSGASSEELAGRLAAAKQDLDRAASVDLSLHTNRLPQGVDGVTDAKGVATHDPAFEGTITIAATGLFDGQTVEVVAVGGDVFAQTPFSSSFIRVDPADFNAPDPAALMDPDTGLSTLLSEATDLSQAGEERQGDQVLTSISGTVPGAAVGRIFPSAATEEPFDVTFFLDGDDRLRRAEVTGPFYAGAPPVTYDITVEPSDEPVEITAP